MSQSFLASLLLLCLLFSKASGNNGKLVTTSISSSQTMSKAFKNVGHPDESLKENITGDDRNGKRVPSMAISSSFSKYHENYQDLTDITEMDYSTATKKSPIHN